MVTPWFLPLGILIGLFGLKTGMDLKRARGGRWNGDALGIAVIGWIPLLIWVAACFVGQAG